MSRTPPEELDAPAPRRVVRALVLVADVGHGHVAAGEAVAEDVRRLGGEAEVRDGLDALGAVARHLIRDGYRLQLRVAPWTFDVMYRLFGCVPLVPRAGARVLAALGRRRLGRLIDGAAPDVVVSTHPAFTAVLGRMRRHGQLDVPVCVTVADLADYRAWCHRGADVHLVMHPAMVAEVERVAGPGSAVLARPFVADPFLRTGDRNTARAALGLPADGRVVAVSGGGWGVGDLTGAVAAALAAGATDVVVLAGRNDRARDGVTRRYAEDVRVRVWGFTDRMADLLQAADVLVHSTGGMTSLEAASAGCPLVAFGADIAHIRTHNAAMERLGLLRVAASRAELRTMLRAHLRENERAPRLGQDGPAPGRIVSAARRRVRPLPAWRLAGAHALVTVAVGCAAVLGMTTDDAYSLASRPLDLRPMEHVLTRRPEVALVVRADAGAAPALAAQLRAAGVRASFATRAPAPATVRGALARSGDELLPELGGTPPGRWLHTRALLAGAARLGGRRLYLASPRGLSLGQDLLARTMHAEPVAGRRSIRLPGGQVPRDVVAGDVIVVSVPASDARAGAELAAVASGLTARGLEPVPVTSLASTAAGSAAERSSATAAPTTTASAATVPAVDTAP
jgi:processive 1,2-diacylglycerol beta-glucosyltransferase